MKNRFKSKLLALTLVCFLSLVPAQRAHASGIAVVDILNWLQNFLTQVQTYTIQYQQYNQLIIDLQNLTQLEMEDLWPYEGYSSGEFNWDEFLYMQERNQALSYATPNLDQVFDELLNLEPFPRQPFSGQEVSYDNAVDWQQLVATRLRGMLQNSYGSLLRHNNRLPKGVIAIVKLQNAIQAWKGAEGQNRLQAALASMQAQEQHVEKSLEITGQNLDLTLRTVDVISRARALATQIAALRDAADAADGRLSRQTSGFNLQGGILR